MRLIQLSTIGDAAAYIASLPRDHDALHWKVAATAIEHAARDANLIGHATQALENALATDERG